MKVIGMGLSLIAAGVLILLFAFNKRAWRNTMNARLKWMRTEDHEAYSLGMTIAIAVAFITIGFGILIIIFANWLRTVLPN